jgi:hypothetical protein
MANQQASYAAAVLRGIGAPVTSGNIAGFIGWSKAEGGDNWQRFNPLNTTMSAPGASSINSVGVKRYTSEQQGINATVSTLKNGNYGGILSAFRANNPRGLAGAIGASPWGTSGSLAAQTIAATLGQHFSAPAGGPSISQPTTKGSAGATNDQVIRVTGGGFVDKRALAEAVLKKEVNRPITSGLHGNPLQDYVNAERSGLYNVPASSINVKVPGQRTATMAPGRRTATATTKLPNGIATFDGKQVAAWIRPALAYARAHGWTGTVTSGYRSFAEQKRIYDSGVRPAAVPGTSNHEGTQFPRGAVDVTNAAQLSAILLKSPYAKLLVYAGSKDPVHFSHPHGGSY